MTRLHLVPEANEANGVFHVARLLARAPGDAVRTLNELPRTPAEWAPFDEVWVHGMWLPREWRACQRILAAGRPLVRMPHGSLSPLYLRHQSPWKKRLVAPIERFFFHRCTRIVTTGPWEEAWCRAWGLEGPFETIDLKAFFPPPPPDSQPPRPRHHPLHVLYLGREHPLKGLALLQRAIRALAANAPHDAPTLRIETAAFGPAKEAAFAWADLLCLPTLSENFGLVIAEAIARGLPVLTTDGAPAWADLPPTQGHIIKGFCATTDDSRIRLLANALCAFDQPRQPPRP